MALKGLDIFKLSPKKNCKEYGFLHEGCFRSYRALQMSVFLC